MQRKRKNSKLIVKRATLWICAGRKGTGQRLTPRYQFWDCDQQLAQAQRAIDRVSRRGYRVCAGYDSALQEEWWY